MIMIYIITYFCALCCTVYLRTCSTGFIRLYSPSQTSNCPFGTLRFVFKMLILFLLYLPILVLIRAASRSATGLSESLKYLTDDEKLPFFIFSAPGALYRFLLRSNKMESLALR